MKFNRFFNIFLAGVTMLSAWSCKDDNGGSQVVKVSLEAEMAQFPEGVTSFDPENGVLTIESGSLMTSAISFSDAGGADLTDYKLKTDVPAADKAWCVASCSKRRLSLSVAKNSSENPRQTDIDITAYFEDQAAGTYTLTVVQRGEKKDEPVQPEPSVAAEITQFIIPGQISSQINYPTITVVMPQGTDVTALKPVIVVSDGSAVTPGSGVAQNFTEAVQYQVVNEKAKDSKTYFAVVTTQASGGGSDPGTGEETNPNFKPFDMVTVGAGSFILGRDPSGQHKDQTNAHKVNISAFEMGRYEVTQREFQEVMGYNPSVNKDSDLYPVHKVTLYEAMNYCNTLSKKKGYTPVYTFSEEKWDSSGKELLEAVVARDKSANGYRLPTNAEFEYAMKGGPDNADSPYFFAGSNDIDDVCWYEDNAIVRGKGEDPIVHVVGLKKPNALGIYDLSGNIEEYTGEWYLQLDYVSDAEETDPWGPEKPRDMQEQYVISRGGCFSTYNWNCSVIGWRLLGGHIKTDMNFPGGEIWFGQIGFRVVRSLK